MSNDKGAKPGADWLSAPAGTTTSTTSASSGSTASDPVTGDIDTQGSSSAARSGEPDDSTALTPAVTDTTSSAGGNGSGSKYKSSFTNSLSTGGLSTGDVPTGGLYPGGETTSPAYAAPADPGPATSIGLGSAATSTGIRPVKAGKRAGARGPRRAKLQIRHIDPWSTLKLSLVLAVAFFFVWMIAVAVLYGVLSAMGVFESIDGLFAELGTDAGRIVTPKLVFGGAALIGAINIVLFTALATIGAYIYNLCADLAGGLEITLAERR